ncbi:MAG: Sapep family Mn(2+)-dependent dipeptidase [Bacilli bacterium]|nr:Sapep family Mn(2+)-dependent dipeptidase [Bacilli bacterium]
MPNFRKLAQNYHNLAEGALAELVKKKSVYDPSTIGEGAPYGKGVKSALDFVANLGEEYGFKVDRCNGYATEISFGEGNGPLIGIYAHSDVVPVSGKWEKEPFSANIVGEGKERKMISRGATDDKGPLIASLMAMKLLKDNNLLDGYRVRLVTGGDEERGSSCLAYYFHTLKKPHCDLGFTPDADFPLIYAEKGIYRGDIKRKIDLSPIIAISGGHVSNAVCDRILVTVKSDKKLEKKLTSESLAEVSSLGEAMILTFKGKTSHGSTPEQGDNAGIKALKALGEYYGIDFLKTLSSALSDPNGAGFDGKESSPELGLNTYNYGIFKYDDHSKILSISLDFRYGEAAHPDECIEKIKKAVSCDLPILSKSPLLLFDKKSPLVSTLMKSYKRMSHKLFAKPFAIGGGTYAKEAKNIVAYGGAFPGHPGNIHSPNEYFYMEDLHESIAYYADAIYSLGHAKK